MIISSLQSGLVNFWHQELAQLHVIDQDMLGVFMSTAQRLEDSGNMEGADRIKDIYRHALRISMKSKIKTSE